MKHDFASALRHEGRAPDGGDAFPAPIFTHSGMGLGKRRDGRRATTRYDSTGKQQARATGSPRWRCRNPAAERLEGHRRDHPAPRPDTEPCGMRPSRTTVGEVSTSTTDSPGEP